MNYEIGGKVMARFGIISAMPVEIECIIEKFGAKEKTVKGFYRVFEGTFNGHEVFLACCGIGKVNAAVCTQKLIDCFGADYIINMGIAGGIAAGIGQLDIVIASEVFYHDFSPADLLSRYFPFAQLFACDNKLVILASKVCDNSENIKNHFIGKVASGDCFVETTETKEKIAALGGICCEMEGAAIGHVCHINGIPFLVVRSISDLADEGAKMSYDEFEKIAARQANRIVEGILAAM